MFYVRGKVDDFIGNHGLQKGVIQICLRRI
jgi:hypothetical protein